MERILSSRVSQLLKSERQAHWGTQKS